MADRWAGLDKKFGSQSCDQAKWAYDGIVFEVKKEIPDKRSQYSKGTPAATAGLSFPGEEVMNRNVSMMRNASVVPAALFVLILLFAQTLAGQVGATYYVSTTGSDNNTGTFSSPWLTIQYAADKATAGATVYVMGGVYNQSVNFPNSGTAGKPITFESYPGQTAVIDGTGVSCCASYGERGDLTQGLVNIVNQSYITISGFEIRNYTTSNENDVPTGIWITGSGTGVQILNNLVHNITTTSETNGNAFGISVYGTSQTPITQLVISGNEVYDLMTGNSESVNVDGNVTYFQITNNLVHDNDNIGIAAIGYEGVGSVGYDEAMYGEISGNTVYNISGITNEGEGSSYDADGIYCDGCAYVTIENNWIYNADVGIEVTSENQICLANGTEWSGPNNTGTPGTGIYPCYGRYATVRNNIFSNSANFGIGIGGYAAASSNGDLSNGGGSSYDAVFVNNTLYNNVKVTAVNDTSSPGGEFQISYQIGSSQDNYFESNLVYAGSYNHWIYSSVASSTSYPAPPATLNYNLYYSTAGYVKGKSIDWDNVSSYTSFATFQSTTGEDGSSMVSNPAFESLTATPSNFDITAASPTVNYGGTSLSCSIGWCDPNGNSPSSIYGATDFLGNPRMTSGAINIGAYQVTGIATNTLTVSLTAGTYTLQAGQSTTLTATVSASPGGGGAPSGTVNFMLGSTLLSTQTLLPTSATTTAASMPFSASQLAAGTNTLTAVYSGNTMGTNCCTATYPPGGATQVAWYPSATSSEITMTGASQQPQTISCTNPPSSAAYGSQFTMSCTATSGLAVTYTSSGSCSNSGATYTMTSGTGICSVIANQAGDGNYLAAPQATASVTATKATQTIVFTYVPSSATYNSNFTVTAASGASPVVFANDGSGVCSNSGATYTMTSGTGTCTVIANQAGNGNYLAAPQATASVTATRAKQTIAFTTNAPATAIYNSNFTVATTGGASGNPVTFTSGGSCSNVGATYTMTSGTGTCTVIANQAGNSNYSAAPMTTASVNAAPAPQAITFSTSAPATAAYNSNFTVAVSASSGLAVGYTSFGSCGNAGATYTMTSGSGTCSVIANQAGNNNYLAATPVAQNVTATPATQSITFTRNAPASAAYNSSFTVAASASSGLAVTYTSSGVCSNVGATYTMTSGMGTCSVIANQAGNSYYSAATPVTQSVIADKGTHRPRKLVDRR